MISEKQILLSVTNMIAYKKVKREEGSTFTEFLTELLKNEVHLVERRLRNVIFQKNEIIRNLCLEKAEYNILGENKDFEINELKRKNENITVKFEQLIKLLKKERLSNEFLSKQLDSFKDKNLDQKIIDEIEELVAERTVEEAALEIHKKNDTSDLTITKVHSEIQSDDEYDDRSWEGIRNPEPEQNSYKSKLKDLLSDDDEENFEAIDVEVVEEEEDVEEDTDTFQESDTEISYSLSNTETFVTEDEVDEEEPFQGDLSNLLEDTFEASGTEINSDDEMDIADSTDITEENTSAGELSSQEFGDDIDTVNHSEGSLDDVGNSLDDEDQFRENLREATDEASSPERTEEANESESERMKEPESCSSLSVPSKSAGSNRNKMRKRRLACGHCSPCLREDCGDCSSCRDKPKFGGLNKRKQKCLLKKCQNLST